MSTALAPWVLRTPLAAQALAGRAAFTLRQRSVLLMAEGMPRPTLDALFHGQGAALVQELLAAGYLEEQAPHAVASSGQPSADTPALHLARLRAQLLELCERLLHEQDGDLGIYLRRLLVQAPDLPSLHTACDRWMQALLRQGGARRIHCLRHQLALLLAPPQFDAAVMEHMDDADAISAKLLHS